MNTFKELLSLKTRSPEWKNAWKLVAPQNLVILQKEPFGGTGPYHLEEVFHWIFCSWKKETSSDSDNWTQSNPSWGQCAITAMMLHKLFRDQEPVEIQNCRAHLPDGRNISHYAPMLLESQTRLDFTEIQFPTGTIFTDWITKIGNEENGWNCVAMASEQTRMRYEKLLDSTNLWLASAVYKLLGT